MKMKISLAVLMVTLALVGLLAPMAFAQAPAPKVSITGFIDEVTSYAKNNSVFSGVFNREDRQWYARTRGRFDIVGEVGKAKAVLGIEIDQVWGQAGSNDSTIVNGGTTPPGGGAVTTQSGTSGSFDLNTDTRGILEVKWLYIEFPMPLIPVPTTVRLGAQPFGAAANYKLAAYATGDFPGINIVSTVTPNVKIVATYVQVEENLVGTQTRTGLSGPLGINNFQNRGDDFAYILAPEITPFKGLDIKPMFSMFYAQGTTNGSSRQGRGGLNTSTVYTNADGTSHGGINEYRYTTGLDARLRMGPFSLDPTVLYQFGNKSVMAPSGFVDSGATTGRKYHPDIDAWLIDVRAGFQLGPLLLEALAMYTTGNTARNNTLGTVRYFQPLDTDTGYLADWGTQLSSLGVDFSVAQNGGASRVSYPGVSIGWDKYGRRQVGFKATYAITPALSVMAGANGIWTAEEVDRNGTAVASSGILPKWAGPRPRDNSDYIGTELMAKLTWRFADGLMLDNGLGYMFMGRAMDAITDPAAGGRNTSDPFVISSRLVLSF